MILQKLNLLLLSVLVIILFFNIPVYNRWMYEKLFPPKMNVLMQAKHMGEEERKYMRFGDIYRTYSLMKEKLGGLHDPVFLLPPDGFLKANDVAFISPEPAVFYYFTGLRSVLPNSPNVYDANWALMFRKNDKMSFLKIKRREALDSLLLMYRKYDNP